MKIEIPIPEFIICAILKKQRIAEYLELCTKHNCLPRLKEFKKIYSVKGDYILLNGVNRENLQRITGNKTEAIVHNEDFMHTFRNMIFYSVIGKLNPELEYLYRNIDQYLDENEPSITSPDDSGLVLKPKLSEDSNK